VVPLSDQGEHVTSVVYNVMHMLGEFEYLLLSAAARLGDEAYGAAIRAEVQAVTGRRCSIGALYTTLDRLEQKGLVRTRIGEPTEARGGRAKRMVSVTPRGVQAAREFYNTVTRISRGVAWQAAAEKGRR
jgi:DNA-binding PadR family transcriptional regulator